MPIPIKKFKEYWNKLIHSHATPEEVAWGFALGIFIAMTPTIGLHTIATIALAAFFKKNEIAAIIGAWIVNPMTIFPIFYFTFKVGRLILGESGSVELRPESVTDLFHMSGEILLPLWIGGIVIGLLSALISYYLVKWIYPYLKKGKEQMQVKISKKLHH